MCCHICVSSLLFDKYLSTHYRTEAVVDLKRMRWGFKLGEHTGELSEMPQEIIISLPEKIRLAEEPKERQIYFFNKTQSYESW